MRGGKQVSLTGTSRYREVVIMRTPRGLAAGLAVLFVAATASAATYSIPPDQLDQRKIYCGKPSGFNKPGEVDYQAVIKATPEYAKIKKEKIQRGSGRYWLLVSKASDRVDRAIRKVGSSTEYDLIAKKGYLGGLNPAVPSDDITRLVIETMSAGSRTKRKVAG